MKRVLLILTTLVLLATASYATYRAMASDETKIRWILQDAATSFNSMSRGGCLASFHVDYKDTTTRVLGMQLDRTSLGQALLLLFTRDVDGRTGEFRLRLLPLADDDIEITIDEDEATATFELHLERRSADDWKSSWELRVTAKIVRDNGSWLIQRSSYETLSGRRPR